MTFLAILKDSWRETLDSKVLYFMLALSLLVVVGVASISFQPKPADKGLEAIFERFPGNRLRLGAFVNRSGPLRYELHDFQQLNDAKPWDGEYRFDLIVREVAIPNPEGKEESSEGSFPAIVWITGIQGDETNLSAEDREARKRLLAMREQAQNLPPEELKKFLNEKTLEEVSKVTSGQMERFLKQQLSAHGGLETSRVTLQSKKLKEYSFTVEARGRSETYRTWPHTRAYLFGAIRSQEEEPIGTNVYELEQGLIGTWGAGIAMLIAAIITAFYIPNMLHKGTVDLLIAKPVRRSELLVYKFVGGLTFMFLNTVFVVVGIWLALGLRSGLWAPGFLLSIFTLTFEFAIFYAVSTLFGVLTRSAVVSILMSCVLWAVLFAVGNGYQFVEAVRDLDMLPGWLVTTADIAHFVLPRYKDIDALNSQAIAHDLLGSDSPTRKSMDKVFASIKWGESLGFTTAFIAVMLGLSCWRFATRDY
jgi:ABC-type transport system involved in multi-copper enzyme maturation permease subunit